MVSIDAVGGEASIWTTYERLAVEACLKQLKNHGYFVPDFSYFRVKQLQARESNVILTTERLCRLNRQDRDLIDHQYTIASVSFRAILNQVVDTFGLTWMGGEPRFLHNCRFQAKISFYRTSQPNTQLFNICSSIYGNEWEAEESALVRALAYFDEVLGWTIGDRNYLIYLRMRAMQ
ncbi:hypothetical protein PVAP13_3KG406900 [Panicum virgatum]|uniref:Uncharacterized protein n=1 Tax=Panicum virgatum TaxID=38727 RepID=A0A8T0V914_PANVG|nr:hypothetical protein PVAP13_3KG406900 [Panicum virgatum]